MQCRICPVTPFGLAADSASPHHQRAEGGPGRIVPASPFRADRARPRVRLRALTIHSLKQALGGCPTWRYILRIPSGPDSSQGWLIPPRQAPVIARNGPARRSDSGTRPCGRPRRAIVWRQDRLRQHTADEAGICPSRGRRSPPSEDAPIRSASCRRRQPRRSSKQRHQLAFHPPSFESVQTSTEDAMAREANRPPSPASPSKARFMKQDCSQDTMTPGGLAPACGVPCWY